jgi:small subunit ribosomal protein S21
MKNGLTVVNNKDNIEVTLRKFKKKVADSGILEEVKNRQNYVKPTTQKKIRRNAAKNRWQKYLNSQELPQKYY